ncbi:hypothetical protein [Sphingosinicella sp. BN140058]|uniref:hypothetical protein n=1 Tax=Sphingosinicella sp. BN140058 TaxID=1892855 RepID=UPI0010138A7A|nr:hypothetical protein [Sphingosinicella sp. BN140058]QAY80291.1 hypothetical protein ETR14_26985 [Sphingosinicella sp. BN140058]
MIDPDYIPAMVTGSPADPVTSIRLSPTARAPLKRLGLLTVGEIDEVSDGELLGTPAFHEEALVELRTEVNRYLARSSLTYRPMPRRRRPLNTHVEGRAMHCEPTSPRLATGVSSDPAANLDLEAAPRRAINDLGLQTIGELDDFPDGKLLYHLGVGRQALRKLRSEVDRYLGRRSPVEDALPRLTDEIPVVNQPRPVRGGPARMKSIKHLRIDIRIRGILCHHDLRTIGDVDAAHDSDLQAIKNIGPARIAELRAAVDRYFMHHPG